LAERHTRLSARSRRLQIIEAALPLFARQGFQGTTTREVADRAGVNEALIFRHFPRKEDLYWAILEHKCAIGGGQERLQNQLRAPSNERELFAAIAEDLLRRHTEDTTLTRLLLFSALEHHRLSYRFFRTHIAEYYEALAGHIRKRIREGKFRRVDPLLAARGFLGMISYHLMIEELFGGKHKRRFRIPQVSRMLAEIWLRGMRARNGAGPRRETASRHR